MGEPTKMPWYYRLPFLASIALVVILIVLVPRVVLFSLFDIRSGSMKPTLRVGDKSVAAKYAYGIGPYTLPFGPHPFLSRSEENLPEYGDVVAFTTSTKGPAVYVKRVVGLPGDRIQMKDGILYINGEAMKQERVEDLIDKDDQGNEVRKLQYRETLPNGVSHKVISLTDHGTLDNTRVYQVPDGELFLLGDNRDNSLDSRIPSQFGRVTLQNLVGRFDYISFDGVTKEWTWREVNGTRD
jgi:signal peptidase I